MKRPIVITLLLLFALSAAPGCSVKHDDGARSDKAAAHVRR
ncbi:MAG TPA: hypothetical protein VNI02_11130 [Blastocatellia bacterium]|jgi:hypothetical protein|nr:hypothetical protein [Blastocatellia bacterium]